jgi:hypothetical protein
MGRPKKRTKKVEKTAERPLDERVAIIHLKGSVEYAEWLEGFHQTTHVGKATLVRLGLIEMAKRYKYPAPPEL